MPVAPGKTGLARETWLRLRSGRSTRGHEACCPPSATRRRSPVRCLLILAHPRRDSLCGALFDACAGVLDARAWSAGS